MRWSQSKIDALLDRLIADGFVERGDTEYRLLSLTRAGWDADQETLAGYSTPPRGAATPAAARGAATTAAKLTTGSALPLSEALGEAADEIQLDAHGEDLLARLKAWRAAQARERAIPPYIIAHDRQLRDVALHQPARHRGTAEDQGLRPGEGRHLRRRDPGDRGGAALKWNCWTTCSSNTPIRTPRP